MRLAGGFDPYKALLFLILPGSLLFQEIHLHVILAGEGESKILHEIFLLPAGNLQILDVHFSGENGVYGVFDGFTEAVVDQLVSGIQIQSHPDEFAHVFRLVAALEDVIGLTMR